MVARKNSRQTDFPHIWNGNHPEFISFEIINGLIRCHNHPPPDYAAFPSISFDVWTRVVAWAKLRRHKYSPDVQELFGFVDLYQSVLPLGEETPLYSYLVDSSDEFGPDIVSFRHDQLQKLVARDLMAKETLWEK